MKVTAPGERPTRPPQYAGLVVFVALAGFWAIAWALPGASAALTAPWLARGSGYLACFFMLWPYVHFLRRLYRGHRGWPGCFWRIRLSTWMRVHIVSAFLAFGFLLLHSQGKASSTLTFWLTASVWAVMLSGVVGYYGQRALYRTLPSIVPREVGLERYAATCDELRKVAAKDLLPKLAFQGKELWWANVLRLGEKELFPRLEQRVSFWSWLARGLPRDEPPEVDYQHVRSFCAVAVPLRAATAATADAATVAAKKESDAAAKALKELKKTGGTDAGIEEVASKAEKRWKDVQAEAKSAAEVAATYASALKAIDTLWAMVEERTALDFEYRLHQLGRLWLLVHGPASVALLALMLQHIWLSASHGGW